MRVATPDPLIGKAFAGRYLIERKLGTGGMATVYLAEDQELGRHVAIKMLDERHAQDEQFVERFKREAKNAAGLSHPNIVSIYDRGEAEGTYFIVMEFLEGRTLKDLLVRRGPTPVRIAIDYTRQILAALDHSHREGTVHRDIKPHNIVVGPDGRLKVTDFGIARSGTSQMTEAGSIIGTAQYLSPEQAKGEPVSDASDLYSVGIVLCEMLTGSVPFTGDTPLEIAMKHLSAVPEPPSAANPKVPHELDAVVLRALAKDPADRYQSAAEMDADLARVAQGLPVAPATEEAATAVLSGAGINSATTRIATQPRRTDSARTPPPYARSRYYDYQQPVRRRPLWPWLLALLLLAAAGFAGYYVYTKIQDQLDAAKPVQVPFVEGQSEPIARANIRRAELVPVVKRMPSNTVAAGKVFEQNPKGGEGTDKGNQVTLTVSTGKPKTTVPDVRGKPIADAAVALDNAGLKYHQVAVHSAEQPGTVTGQNPPPGTQVLVGDTVRINVSQGPAPVSVPNVVGMSADAATSTLRNLGFAVVTTQVDSDEPAGTVVETIPSHDTSVQPGTTVTLKLSKGPQTTAVPDVTGLDQSTAVELLRSYGFKARITKVTTSSETEDARVLAQIPASGSQANPGSSVDLTVGKYVAPAPPPPPPVQTTPTTPADTGPVLIPPTDTGPVQTSPTDTGPVQTSPTDTGPVQMPPTDTTPTDTIPTDTTPTDTTPTDTEPPSTDTTPTTTVPASPPPSPPSVP